MRHQAAGEPCHHYPTQAQRDQLLYKLWICLIGIGQTRVKAKSDKSGDHYQQWQDSLHIAGKDHAHAAVPLAASAETTLHYELVGATVPDAYRKRRGIDTEPREVFVGRRIEEF